MERSRRRRSRLRFLSLAAAALATSSLVAFACGFPDPSFVEGGAEAGPDRNAPDAPGDTDARPDTGPDTRDAGPDGYTDPDAPGDDADVVERGDALNLHDAGPDACGPNPCDCDNDGYLAMGDACAGDDCDDRDGHRHPGQGFTAEPPPPGQDGDWDCSGTVERQYPSGLDCSSFIGINCNASAQGFINRPECSQNAPYYRCTPGPLSCTAVQDGERRQGCK